MSPEHSERRRYRRYPVTLYVEINDGGVTAIAGKVCDVCMGGALVGTENKAWLGSVAAGKELDLAIDLPVKGTTHTLMVSARVVRVQRDKVAVRFETLPQSAVVTLQRFIEARAEKREPVRVGVGGPARDRVAAIVKQLTAQRGDAILDAWLRNVEEALWDSAEHAQSDAQRSQRNGSAVKFSRLYRQGGLRQLTRTVKERHNAKQTKPQLRQGRTPERLDLVDTDYFETWLESSSLVTHLEEDLEQSLSDLKSQVTHVCGNDALLEFLPMRLANAFEVWCDNQGLEGDVKRIGLTEGRRTLPRLLGDFYRDLSRALTDAGFAPVEAMPASERPTRPVAHHPASARRGGAAADAVRDPQGGAAPAAPATPASVGAAAIQPPGSLVSPDGLSAAQAAELLMTLPHDALFDSAEGGTGRPLKERVFQLLGETRPELADQPLAPMLRDRIDATDRVLKHMVVNTDASSRIRRWVNQLSLRVLAAAVADENFFRHPGHPLLQMVEQLDHLGMVLPEAGAGVDDEVAQQLDRLVGQALGADVRDADAYEPILDQLGLTEQRYSEQFRRDAELAIARLEGQERRDNAHRYVQHELAERFGGVRIHRVVQRFIDTAWGTLLELRYLREGPDGERLARAWQALVQVHALSGEAPPDDTTVAMDVDALEREILDGLSYVGFDPYLAKSTVAEIRGVLRKRRAGAVSADDYLVYAPAEGEAAVAEASAGLPADVSAQLSRQIGALHLGTRIRLRDTHGDSTWRLIWRRPDDSEYAFLNLSNGQVKNLSREALAVALHEGKLRIQSWQDGGIADRALDATLREMQEQLHIHASRDALTGLYTQQQFNAHLMELLGGALPSTGDALGLLEIDHFEVVSSNSGYRAAGQLLQLVSRLLQQRLGEASYIAFLGGARFGFVLGGSDQKRTRALLNALRDDLYRLPFRWKGQAFPVTGSIGMVFVPEGERNADVLLSSLELACATAREAGGNRLVEFSETDDAIASSKARFEWLNAAEEAIKGERIRLRAQQIAPVHQRDGLRGHHELLLRVYDEKGDELDLERFIATAEAFHLMGEVDRLVIHRALTWARDNPDLLEKLGGVAINLSGVSLSDPQLLGYIRGELDHSGVPPQYVSFELTETAAITSLERALGIIEGIKEAGCRVALDDFGTGLSSYTYLKTLPVDYVKIDGSFIRDLPTNPNDLAIVKAINEIAHFMGIKTIAEYVASDEIIGKLDEIGVDYMQGFAVRPPQFLEDLRLPQ